MKPYVICHMNASVDGRILGSRWRPAENRMAGLFERLHEALGGGSWLIGRVTGSEYAKADAYPPTRPIRGNPGSSGVMPPPPASRGASRSMGGARSPGDDPRSAAIRSSWC
jgi:hypothetical protein